MAESRPARRWTYPYLLKRCRSRLGAFVRGDFDGFGCRRCDWVCKGNTPLQVRVQLSGGTFVGDNWTWAVFADDVSDGVPSYYKFRWLGPLALDTVVDWGLSDSEAHCGWGSAAEGVAVPWVLQRRRYNFETDAPMGDWADRPGSVRVVLYVLRVWWEGRSTWAARAYTVHSLEPMGSIDLFASHATDLLQSEWLVERGRCMGTFGPYAPAAYAPEMGFWPTINHGDITLTAF